MNKVVFALGCWLLAIQANATGQEQPLAAVRNLIEHAVMPDRAGAAWTFEKADFRSDTRQLPVGVFDSGIGGLTVLEAILGLDSHNNDTAAPGPDGKPDFQDERFIYFGDQANMPYGNYAAVGKEEFLRELILKDTVFLLGRRYWPSPHAPQAVFSKPPVKAIAVGCNTATAYGLEDIQSAMKAWDIPVFVVGVVDAGARGVLEVQQQRDATNSEKHTVAVLATVGTCNSRAYPKAIGKTLGLAGRRIPDIVQQGCVDLAAAIEGDRQVLERRSIDEIIREDVRQLVENHRQSGSSQPIGSIVLGCTHFPLVQHQLVAALKDLKAVQVDGQQPYDALIADRIDVVNPAELTAKELFRSLARSRLRADPRANPRTEQNSTDKENVFFISVPNPRYSGVQLAEDGGLSKDYKYGRATQQLDIEDTLVVPMKIEQLPPNAVPLICTSLPHVWNSLTGTPSKSAH